MTTSTPPANRLDAIAHARSCVMRDGAVQTLPWLAPEVLRSWRRCLEQGQRPAQSVIFDTVPKPRLTRTLEANHLLIQAAQPMLHNLARAIVNTRYFAILTNADGVVVDACGAIDHTDPRAHLITQVGTDLSERSMGTTAIGMALSELQPVWLHRGEHFFDQTSVYSCAGAPLFGPDGACVGMLDVTGVDAQERPELKHLVMQSASKIENALITALPHALMLRLNWPGNALGSDADGMLCLDPEGWITGANPVARQMVPGLAGPSQAPVHVSEVFGVPVEPLFDAAKRPAHPLELPLWSGLRLQAQAISQGDEAHTLQAGSSAAPARALREVEAAMIRKAVDEARGNVGQAARALGISRATLYRKLGQKPA
ncbi:MAG: helix-turn-helix domain-containing protein [Rhodoferax sp.]|nr:helix-turn-helix domain-containing protein [Rhodoferax sp.]